MFDMNLQYIAGGLAIFFITLAVYKALSQRAIKRAAAAKSLAQSRAGQDVNVSLHNPYPNGAPIPEAPPPSYANPSPQPPAPPAPVNPPPPAPVQTAPISNPPPPSMQPQATAEPSVQPPPEQIYKWN